MIDLKGTDKLSFFKEKLSKNDALWRENYDDFDAREALFRGSDKIFEIVENDKKTVTPHVRNIVSELIEAQVQASVPQPKVTAVHPKDVYKAALIERMIRNELDRLPVEEINDMMERTIPVQGGGVFCVEWDDTIRIGGFTGDVTLSVLHPKQIVPQDGVYTSVDDMDYIFTKMPQTKSYIRERYGVDVDMETETEPEVKAVDGGGVSEDLVTQYTAYYAAQGGAIGRFSWVNDTVLEDLEDYRARRVMRCGRCKKRGAESEEKCSVCGGRLSSHAEEYEEIYVSIPRRDGSVIPGADINPAGEPTRVKYYRPSFYPLVFQKNISVFGQLMGESDVDKIKTQQNTTNRLEAKIIDRLIKAGTRVTMSEDTALSLDSTDGEIWRISDPAQKAMIGTYDFSGNLDYELSYLNQVYEEARQTLGITDSFQGRRDTTATSKVSKEFSAQQSAGRLESKRVLKQAAWARIFEAIFKLKLAYADEERPVSYRDRDGNNAYEVFSRYDFLEQNERGEWEYNDAFLFSCDTAAPLSNNREALWQETRMNLESGAFGDRTQLDTLILFWNKMEEYNYPGAGDTKKYLTEQKRIQAQTEMQAQSVRTGFDNAVMEAIGEAER